MNPLTTFVRSLGGSRATANAQAMLEARRHEDWVLQGLVQRLEPASPTAPAAAADPRTAAA